VKKGGARPQPDFFERGEAGPDTVFALTYNCAQRSLWEGGHMPTLIAFHEVDDVDHWLSSPKRAEVFGPLGIAIRTFRDPEGSNRVGLIADIPDMAAWQELMQSEAGADAMKFDGVRPETLVVLTEG
jgi:hypothetical protein